MPPRSPQSPPPADGAVTLMRELQALEHAGETSDMRLGPLSGYLLLSALTGAMRAPRVTGSVLEAGERVRVEIRRAAGVPVLDLPNALTLVAVYMQLDEMSEPAAADLDVPGDGFVELIMLLQHLEQENVRLDVHIGPLTLFFTISLLQLALRHPSVAAYVTTTGQDGGPVEMIARGLCENFGGYARQLLEQGFDPRFDVDGDGELIDPLGAAAASGFPVAEGTALPVGLGPDDIFDVVTVAQASCPGCGENPMLAVSAEQAFCGNDDCRVMVWNPSQTAEQFWASATEQVLVRDPETGITRNVDADKIPEGAQLVGDLEEGLGFEVLIPTGGSRLLGGRQVPEYVAATEADLDEGVRRAFAEREAAERSVAGDGVDEQRGGEQHGDAEHD